TDDEGRQISIDDNWNVSATGFNSTPLSWTGSYGPAVQSSLQYLLCDAAFCCSDEQVMPNAHVLKQIQLPSALGGGSYVFNYGESQATNVPPYTGQLRSITLPSGAQVNYTWGADGSPASSTASRFVVSPVATKTVQANSQTLENWSFSISPRL